MFDSMHNGWAERDDAHYRNEERDEAREAMRDVYLDALVGDLIAIGQAYGKNARMINKTECQQRDEAMESAFDWIFSNPAQQTWFETALLQIWATYRCKEDSPMSRLADVIDYGMTAFASQKAKEKYQ
jgi:hypothetical protein